MPERLERAQVAPGTAAEVEQFERWRRLDVLQQRADVLADVVIARAFPEVPRALVVVRQCARGDLAQSSGVSGMRDSRTRSPTPPRRRGRRGCRMSIPEAPSTARAMMRCDRRRSRRPLTHGPNHAEDHQADRSDRAAESGERARAARDAGQEDAEGRRRGTRGARTGSGRTSGSGARRIGRTTPAPAKSNERRRKPPKAAERRAGSKATGPRGATSRPASRQSTPRPATPRPPTSRPSTLPTSPRRIGPSPVRPVSLVTRIPTIRGCRSA